MPNYEQINNVGQATADAGQPDRQLDRTIYKFQTPGQVAEGIFRGLRKGKYESNLLQIGEKTYGSSTVLDSRFGRIAVGTQVKVIYKGLRQPMHEAGKPPKKPYKDFDIFPDCGPQQAPVINEGPAPVERASSFDQLLSRIQDQKGETIAQALKAAVLSMTTTPEGALEELRSVAAQVGVTDAEVPF